MCASTRVRLPLERAATDAAINVAKRKLAPECDYKHTAAAQTRF
jgi:hypothetical protein